MRAVKRKPLFIERQYRGYIITPFNSASLQIASISSVYTVQVSTQ